MSSAQFDNVAAIRHPIWWAEKFGRPGKLIRLGKVNRKTTAIRRLELRRVRRVRKIELTLELIGGNHAAR